MFNLWYSLDTYRGTGKAIKNHSHITCCCCCCCSSTFLCTRCTFWFVGFPSSMPMLMFVLITPWSCAFFVIYLALSRLVASAALCNFQFIFISCRGPHTCLGYAWQENAGTLLPTVIHLTILFCSVLFCSIFHSPRCLSQASCFPISFGAIVLEDMCAPLHRQLGHGDRRGLSVHTPEDTFQDTSVPRVAATAAPANHARDMHKTQWGRPGESFIITTMRADSYSYSCSCSSGYS